MVLQSLTEKWKNVRFRKPAWQSLKALQRALRASRHVGSCLLSYARCTFNVRGCACADVHARISTSVNQPMQILPALHSVAESWNLETSAHTYRLKFSFPFWNTDGGKMLEVSERLESLLQLPRRHWIFSYPPVREKEYMFLPILAIRGDIWRLLSHLPALESAVPQECLYDLELRCSLVNMLIT